MQEPAFGLFAGLFDGKPIVRRVSRLEPVKLGAGSASLAATQRAQRNVLVYGS